MKPQVIWIVAIQGHHGPELTTGDCGYLEYANAEAKLKEYSEERREYTRVFRIEIQDGGEK